jgi:hypothetical protein
LLHIKGLLFFIQDAVYRKTYLLFLIQDAVCRRIGLLFSTKVRRDFSPLIGLPLQDGAFYRVCVEPTLRSFDNFKQGFALGIQFEFRFATARLDPQHSISAVAVDGSFLTHLLQ